ncbi:MAG: Smr/MutS family protein [Eubacteriaceae bacterium]|nr:Smr/MutS family protein [Eubacteriaceae bacterium]
MKHKSNFTEALREGETIDIHGYTIAEAENELDHFLDYLPEGIDEIRVVHGYKSGKALLNFVRNTYRHERVKRKFVTMNNGETIFILHTEYYSH